MFYRYIESFENSSMHCQVFQSGMIQHRDITLFYLDESSVHHLAKNSRQGFRDGAQKA